jgi:protein-tyrosine phosphatase
MRGTLSASTPGDLYGRFVNLDGGVHRVELRCVDGSLWICGKHAIAPDPDALFARILVRPSDVDVVCLVEEHELVDRYPDYVKWLRSEPSALWCPVPDLSSPDVDRAAEMYEVVWERLVRGRHVVAHCGAGMGRAGTLAVAMCLHDGRPLDEALEHVRRSRPGAGPEVGSQSTVLAELARRLAGPSR